MNKTIKNKKKKKMRVGTLEKGRLHEAMSTLSRVRLQAPVPAHASPLRDYR